MKILPSSRNCFPGDVLADSKYYRLFLIIAAVALGLYLVTGFYTLQSGQEAVVLRFGQETALKKNPGINYHLPRPFERVQKVHVRQVQKVMVESGKGKGVEGFTGDENLLLVRSVINFDVRDLHSYLFNIADQPAVIIYASEMCLNEEIAGLSVDDIMTTGKSVLRLVLKDRIQAEMDALHAGVRIISVELTDIAPPNNVSQAFKSVSDAREKKQRIIKEAEGYANATVPRARGEAASIISGAQAYREEALNLAQARTEAFTALNTEYRKNPSLTAKLKYLETLQRIYQKCGVTIDSDPSNSTYYIGKDGNITNAPQDSVKSNYRQN